MRLTSDTISNTLSSLSPFTSPKSDTILYIRKYGIFDWKQYGIYLSIVMEYRKNPPICKFVLLLKNKYDIYPEKCHGFVLAINR